MKRGSEDWASLTPFLWGMPACELILFLMGPSELSFSQNLSGQTGTDLPAKGEKKRAILPSSPVTHRPSVIWLHPGSPTTLFPGSTSVLLLLDPPHSCLGCCCCCPLVFVPLANSISPLWHWREQNSKRNLRCAVCEQIQVKRLCFHLARYWLTNGNCIISEFFPEKMKTLNRSGHINESPVQHR